MSDHSSPTPLTLRADDKNRRQAPWLVITLVVIFVLSTVGMGFVVPHDRRALTVAFFGLFWGAWLLLALYNWRLCKVHVLRLDDNQITRVGAFGEKVLSWNEVTVCRWLLGPSFSIRLRTASKGLWLHRDTYKSADQLALIRLLRDRIPEDQQKGWDLFCWRVALPLTRPPLQEGDPLPHGMVRLTRRTWDLYFLPVTVIVAIIASTLAVISDTPRIHAAPLGLLGIWAMLRWMTPKQGMVAQSVNADQFTQKTLRFLALWTIFGVGGLAAWPHREHLIVSPFIFAWFLILLCQCGRHEKMRQRVEIAKRKNAVEQWNLRRPDTTENL